MSVEFREVEIRKKNLRLKFWPLNKQTSAEANPFSLENYEELEGDNVGKPKATKSTTADVTLEQPAGPDSASGQQTIDTEITSIGPSQSFAESN